MYCFPLHQYDILCVAYVNNKHIALGSYVSTGSELFTIKIEIKKINLVFYHLAYYKYANNIQNDWNVFDTLQINSTYQEYKLILKFQACIFQLPNAYYKRYFIL